MLFVMFSGVTTVSAAPPAFKFTLSSGLFSLPANAQAVDWVLLNDSSSSQDFRVTVYQANGIVLKTAVVPGAVTGSINPNEAFHNANNVPFPFVPGYYYEVVVEINDLNVLPTTHVWQDSGNTVIPGTRIGPTEFKLLR
jgi:hypothetical protein